MKAEEKCVYLIYIAEVDQNTGEDSNDVPLTLETPTPTSGLGIARLDPWVVSTYKPSVLRRTAVHDSVAPEAPSPSSRPPMNRDSDDLMDHRTLAVTSKGNISATFQVPGVVTIPSDLTTYNVTIEKFSLDATMSWVCVPKKDTKTYLNARIKNTYEYTLLSGQASVYVDGSFISQSDVPAVNPGESFNCPLGVDPSIRVTYKPRFKKVSPGVFCNKTIHHNFLQYITIFNSKTTAIKNLKIIDQIPVSEDAQVNVKLVNPSLSLPSGDSSVFEAPAPLKVSNGVIAQWDGADEPGHNVESLGKDGKLNWICSIPSQGNVNLVMQWVIAGPVRTGITGL